MLTVTYYAQNYAGIIGWSLLDNDYDSFAVPAIIENDTIIETPY